jgi:hypothetical protein
MVLTVKRGTNLETNLLEVRHMSRPKFFYLGLPTSTSKPTISDMCGLLDLYDYNHNQVTHFY